MTWQVCRLADIPPTPWRNGGGQTRELVAWPSPAAWRWRISVAEVASDGPFSRFDGVQRWLAILHGQGVRLDFERSVVELRATGAPLAFDGAEAVQCTLLDGPVRDLNLMLRTGASADQAAGRMLRLYGRARVHLAAGHVGALYAQGVPARIRGCDALIDVPADGLAWGPSEHPAEIDIEAGEACWMDFMA